VLNYKGKTVTYLSAFISFFVEGTDKNR